MGHDIAIGEKEKERAALLEEAARVLELVEKDGRSPNQAEDARIVELATRAQELEHEITHLTRDKKKHRPHEQ